MYPTFSDVSAFVVRGVTKNGSVVASSDSRFGVVWNVVDVLVVGLNFRSVVDVGVASLVLSSSSSS